MLPELTENEARVLGCLLEKAVTTPDQYPLTLNALTNACNQKSGRDPVMNLGAGQVEHAARSLEEKRLVKAEENFKSGVKKYRQKFCNQGLHQPEFDTAQYAILTLLLLRGAQTPGEVRARSPRLHSFDDNADVTEAMQTLIDHKPEALVVKLPRMAGRKDNEYMHLLAGEIDVSAYEKAAPAPVRDERPSSRNILDALELRLAALEAEVSELKEALGV